MEETGEPSPPFAIVLSNLWIAYGFIQTVLERRPGDVHRLVRVVIEFQQVREQKGLCYSIYSYGTCHDDTGYFGVYTALGRETEGQALDTILAVIRELTEHGVTQAELDRAREQSKANVLMGLESAQSHMSSLGRGEVLDEDAFDAGDLKARLMALPFMQGAPELEIRLLPCGALREHCYEKKRILEREAE